MDAQETMGLIAKILVVVGGLNWLLVAFGWNLVELLFGAWPTVVKVVYILVGLAALWMIYLLFTEK